jgi:hypothetical protein
MHLIDLFFLLFSSIPYTLGVAPESFQIGIGHTIPWEELKVKGVFKIPLNEKVSIFFHPVLFPGFDFAVLAFGRRGHWIGLWTSCPNSHY